jgi:hypothetical protein
VIEEATMEDRGGRDRRDEGGHHGGERRGPPDTSWLQLEMSKVIEAGAEDLARAAVEEILKDAIKARLEERLGPKLEALGRLCADRIADDVEANLDIEARIAARREARRATEAQMAAVFRPPRGSGEEREERG